jgi:hypothetical protein
MSKFERDISKILRSSSFIAHPLCKDDTIARRENCQVSLFSIWKITKEIILAPTVL